MRAFTEGLRRCIPMSGRGFGLSIFMIVLLSLAVSVGAPRALAQSTTEGAIGGTVFDPSGAVVPGAAVTVHNNGTNAEHAATTDASGYYFVGPLPPAIYTVTVTATGFETYKAEQVVVSVGSVTSVSPHLTVGATSQTVTVTGSAPQINTTSA